MQASKKAASLYFRPFGNFLKLSLFPAHTRTQGGKRPATVDPSGRSVALETRYIHRGIVNQYEVAKHQRSESRGI